MKKVLKSGLPLCLSLVLALSLWGSARAASGTDYRTVLETTMRQLRETVRDPVSGSISGEWAVFALARGGLEDDVWFGRYLEHLFPVVDECGGVLHRRKYTEYSRVVIALSALGQDARCLDTGKGVYDLVSPLMSRQTNGEYWASWQGNNGTAFAILALDSQNYFDDEGGRQARAGLLDALLSAQRTDGAWSISGGGADIDTTAMALQALAPYLRSRARFDTLGAAHSYSQLESAVSGALDYLNTVKTGDFGSAEASAQVVAALAALDRDAAEDALLGDVLGSLLAYYDGSGGFFHLKGGADGDNQMSTEQACYALVAYDRWKQGQSSLYDMSDRGLVEEIRLTAPETVDAAQTATGTLRVTGAPCLVLARCADGSLRPLTPEGTGEGRTFHTLCGSVTVLVRGDANGDGAFDGEDVALAKAAYLNKASLGELRLLAMDLDGDGCFDGSDIAAANAASLGRRALPWCEEAEA